MTTKQQEAVYMHQGDVRGGREGARRKTGDEWRTKGKRKRDSNLRRK